MSNHFRLSAFAIFILLAGCGTVQNPPANDGIYIDPSIQGQDREALSQAMHFVPENQRKNFTLVTADGRLLANRPELLVGASLLTPERIGDNLYRYRETGETFSTVIDQPASSKGAILPQAVDCTNGASTGPFYRSMSKPGLGDNTGLLNYWTASRSTIQLPTALNVKYDLNFNQTETPYIILGGWGNNDAAYPIDAGVQGNLKRINGNFVWQWQNFLKVGTTVSPTVSNPNLRFANGSSISLTFNVYQKTSTSKEAQVSASQNGNTTASTYPISGWSTNGYNNVMKRLTGLAQKNGFNASNGSYVFVTTWLNIQIGGTRGTYPGITSGFVDWSGNGKYQCFNPNSTKISLSDISLTDYFEDITVDLR